MEMKNFSGRKIIRITKLSIFSQLHYLGRCLVAKENLEQSRKEILSPSLNDACLGLLVCSEQLSPLANTDTFVCIFLPSIQVVKAFSSCGGA